MAAPQFQPNLPPPPEVAKRQGSKHASRMQFLGMLLLMLVWFVWFFVVCVPDQQRALELAQERAEEQQRLSDEANAAAAADAAAEAAARAANEPVAQTQPSQLQDVFDDVVEGIGGDTVGSAPMPEAGTDATTPAIGSATEEAVKGELWSVPLATPGRARLIDAPLGSDFADVSVDLAEKGEPCPKLQFVFSNVGATVAFAAVLNFESSGRDHRVQAEHMSYTELLLPFQPARGSFGVGLRTSDSGAESRYLDGVIWELIDAPTTTSIAVDALDAQGKPTGEKTDVLQTTLRYRFPPAGTPATQNPRGLQVIKTFTYRHDQYDLQVDLSFVNNGNEPIRLSNVYLYGGVGIFPGYTPPDANQVVARVERTDGTEYVTRDISHMYGQFDNWLRNREATEPPQFSFNVEKNFAIDQMHYGYGGQAARYFQVVMRSPGVVPPNHLRGESAGAEAATTDGAGDAEDRLNTIDVVARPFDPRLATLTAGAEFQHVAIVGAADAEPGTAANGVITIGRGEHAREFTIDRFRYNVDYHDGDHGRPRRNYVETALKLNAISIEPNSSRDITTYTFIGPRSADTLTQAGLQDSVRYSADGLDFIARPLLAIVGFYFGLFGNFGIAIIFLTMTVRLILSPLSYKAQYAMQETAIKMKKFQPKIAKIREKYGSDKQRMNAELMKLYQKEGIPMSGMLKGCFIMLLQMPIWIALYSSFRYSIDLLNQSFLWINDLSMSDAVLTITTDFELPMFFKMLSDTMAPTGVLHLNILPIVVIALMYGQAKISQAANPQSMDPDQRRQQKLTMGCMYIMFFFIFYGMPAGFNFYFLASSIYGLLESRFVRGRIRAKLEAKHGGPEDELKDKKK